MRVCHTDAFRTTHKYVMVLHDHAANPHIHISVRAEPKHGKRLNPRKADLHRWRETFAEKLRSYGVEAEATRQATRGHPRSYEPLWRVKASEDGSLRTSRPPTKRGVGTTATRAAAVDAWREIALALATSGEKSEQDLAQSISRDVGEMPGLAESDFRKASETSSEQIRLVEQETHGHRR